LITHYFLLYTHSKHMAHKKAAGSAKNLRDSNPKYRWLKLSGGQLATAWNIILRQQGEKYKCGPNTYISKDYTIHAKIDGIVKMYKKKVWKYNARKYLRTFITVESAQAIS